MLNTGTYSTRESRLTFEHSKLSCTHLILFCVSTTTIRHLKLEQTMKSRQIMNNSTFSFNPRQYGFSIVSYWSFRELNNDWEASDPFHHFQKTPDSFLLSLGWFSCSYRHLRSTAVAGRLLPFLLNRDLDNMITYIHTASPILTWNPLWVVVVV